MMMDRNKLQTDKMKLCRAENYVQVCRKWPPVVHSLLLFVAVEGFRASFHVVTSPLN